MNLKTLKILQTKNYLLKNSIYGFSKLYEANVTEILLELEHDSDIIIFGIDPGTTHLGISKLLSSKDENGATAIIYEINFSRADNAIERIDTVSQILQHFLTYDPYFGIVDYKVAIEGASYGNPYRQVELAEVRAACACWGIKNYASNIRFIPPSTVRKTTFGNGKLPAQVFWTELEEYPNAAAALSIALAMKIQDENNETKVSDK